MIEELNFKLNLILVHLNSNSHTCLVASVLESTGGSQSFEIAEYS
jgi:hypothetical protein